MTSRLLHLSREKEHTGSLACRRRGTPPSSLDTPRYSLKTFEVELMFTRFIHESLEMFPCKPTQPGSVVEVYGQIFWMPEHIRRSADLENRKVKPRQGHNKQSVHRQHSWPAWAQLFSMGKFRRSPDV